MPDLFDYAETHLRFDGVTYEPQHDRIRLTKQALRVFNAMQDGQWRTLAQIEDMTRDELDRFIQQMMKYVNVNT